MTYDNLYCVWLTTEMRAETCGKYRYVAEAEAARVAETEAAWATSTLAAIDAAARAEAACCCMDLAAIAENACSGPT